MLIQVSQRLAIRLTSFKFGRKRQPVENSLFKDWLLEDVYLQQMSENDSNNNEEDEIFISDEEVEENIKPNSAFQDATGLACVYLIS